MCWLSGRWCGYGRATSFASDTLAGSVCCIASRQRQGSTMPSGRRWPGVEPPRSAVIVVEGGGTAPEVAPSGRSRAALQDDDGAATGRVWCWVGRGIGRFLTIVDVENPAGSIPQGWCAHAESLELPSGTHWSMFVTVDPLASVRSRRFPKVHGDKVRRLLLVGPLGSPLDPWSGSAAYKPEGPDSVVRVESVLVCGGLAVVEVALSTIAAAPCACRGCCYCGCALL